MSKYICPICNSKKTYNAETCLSCHRDIHNARKVCPECGGPKSAYSGMCSGCYQRSHGELTSEKCGNCGGEMARKRKGGLCMECYKRNGRLDPIHRDDGSTLLPLPHGRFAVIDTEDFAAVKGYSWHLSGNGYVMAKIPGSGKKSHSLHRFIMGLTGNEVVDHRNHDPLDNTKANLSVGTQSENMHNIRPRPGKKYRGVYARRYAGVRTAAIRYTARICKGGKSLNLGSFDTEIEAAEAYDAAALELFGDRAVLNLPAK